MVQRLVQPYSTTVLHGCTKARAQPARTVHTASAYCAHALRCSPLLTLLTAHQLSTVEVFLNDGAIHPGGGVHSSRAGGGGIVPAPRWGPALPPLDGHGPFRGAATDCAEPPPPWRPAMKSLKLLERSSKNAAGEEEVDAAGAGAAGVSATGGVRRLPASYQLCTGGVGGFHPGGGVQSSRTGGGGIVPACRGGISQSPDEYRTLCDQMVWR